MKNSKSQINVFRMGVGGSFDEYDQYRYFFPLSDKYCNLNPPQNAGDYRVDRYMNYLDASGNAYDPITGITSDCAADGSVPAPLQYTDSFSGRWSTFYVNIPGVTTNTYSVNYNAKLPDSSSYKTTYFFRWDFNATYDSDDGGFYEYSASPGGPPNQQDHIFKTVDDGYYRKMLSIAHASTIYDTGNTGTTRAPFECDMSANDCYSASCDSSVYSRGVLLTQPATGLTAQEVVADCNEGTDEAGLTRVICGPTKNVTIETSPNPPYLAPVPLYVRPAYLYGRDNPDHSFNDYADTQDNNEYVQYWDNFHNESFGWNALVFKQQLTYYNAANISVFYVAKKNCPQEYGYNYKGKDNATTFPCESVTYSYSQPYVAGAVFFGKTGDTQSEYNPGTGAVPIIGYALANNLTDADAMYVVKNCAAQNDVIEVSTYYPGTGPTLEATFRPYYMQRVKSLLGTGWGDGCGRHDECRGRRALEHAVGGRLQEGHTRLGDSSHVGYLVS